MKTPKNFAAGSSNKDSERENEHVSENDAQNIDEIQKEGKLTEEDFEALGPEDLSMDMGEDEQLKHRTHPVDFSGGDLDVPGAELDDLDEEMGSEDEENNSYSLGDND